MILMVGNDSRLWGHVNCELYTLSYSDIHTHYRSCVSVMCVVDPYPTLWYGPTDAWGEQGVASQLAEWYALTTASHTSTV